MEQPEVKKSALARTREFVFTGISLITLPFAGIAAIKFAAAGEGVAALLSGLYATSDAVTIRDTLKDKKPTPILNPEWWMQKIFNKSNRGSAKFQNSSLHMVQAAA